MFYVAGVDRVEVSRVLHTRRDIPAAMADETDDP
jgi:plasmid stabilization system protein ParE